MDGGMERGRKRERSLDVLLGLGLSLCITHEYFLKIMLHKDKCGSIMNISCYCLRKVKAPLGFISNVLISITFDMEESVFFTSPLG